MAALWLTVVGILKGFLDVSELVCGFSLTDHFRLYAETESMPDPEALLHSQHTSVQPETRRKLYSGKQGHNRKEFSCTMVLLAGLSSSIALIVAHL